MRLLELLGLSAPVKESVETIKLEGPFIAEDYGRHRNASHAKLLTKTVNECNLTVGRDVLVMSSDYEFSARDDCRIQIGLNHHIHIFELSFRNYKEYDILAIDRFIILNPSDAAALKEYLNHHLPTEEELKRIYFAR